MGKGAGTVISYQLSVTMDEVGDRKMGFPVEERLAWRGIIIRLANRRIRSGGKCHDFRTDLPFSDRPFHDPSTSRSRSAAERWPTPLWRGFNGAVKPGRAVGSVAVHEVHR